MKTVEGYSTLRKGSLVHTVHNGPLWSISVHGATVGISSWAASSRA